MADNPRPEKPNKRASLHRDSRPAARTRRDVLRKLRSADKRRTKSRRTDKK
ncbi:MAG: hypothetical protein K8T20_16500 [Planctomycetes bacterium]|nr:hypothetical protein [Planctomycetota bacterium]